MEVYSVGDVAEYLKMKTPTLRKYCIMLENEGYTFQRNSRNQRYFSDKDVMTVQAILRAKHNGTTLEESVKGVVHQERHITATNETNNAVMQNNSDINELRDLIYKQNELIGELSERMDKQQEYIHESIKARDHNLMETMNEMLETKKQIAAEEKKGFFRRIFKK